MTASVEFNGKTYSASLTFADGAILFATGETDEHGLPVAYIKQPKQAPSIDAHPRAPGVTVQGPLVDVVTRVPVSQVNELLTSGVLKKPEPQPTAA